IAAVPARIGRREVEIGPVSGTISTSRRTRPETGPRTTGTPIGLPSPKHCAATCASTSPGSGDDHQLVAFGIGDPPATLGFVEHPATGGDGRGEAPLRDVRRHGELDVDAVALPSPL